MRPLTFAVSLCLAAPAALAASGHEDPLLEEALFAGGASNQAELKKLEAEFHRRVDPVVKVARGQPDAIAAQLLLRHFHQDYADTRALLVRYEADAFSLNRVLTDGHYNCLAATTLFVLAARQAGLNVKPEFYDDHARAVLVARGREYQVEATSISGFDSDDWILHTEGVLQDGALVMEFPRRVDTVALVAEIAHSAQYFGVSAGSGSMLASSTKFSGTLR